MNSIPSMLGWRSKKTTSTTSVQIPPGFRGSKRPTFGQGEVVGSSYQIRRLLGSTESGQVYEAWDMVLERLVVIKAGWRDEDAPRLLVEARSLASIAGDCVVDIYGIGHHHGVEYMVMEGVAGMTLGDYLREQWTGERRVPVEEGVDLALALARGLAAVHKIGLAHGDLHPDGVLCAGGGRIVFTGFGLAVSPHESPAAPELIRGQRRDPIATDLYCLGSLIVELMCGHPPYAGRTPHDVREAHLHDAIPDVAALPPGLTPELADLVIELLAKDPERRPSSAREVADQLAVIRERVRARPRRDIVDVLVVDHSADEVRYLWSRLRRAHERIQVDAARNATDAIAQVRRSAPQIIVLSLDLPGSMSGFELAMYLQGTGEVRRSTFIALVDELDEQSEAVLAQLGVTRVVTRGAAQGDQLTTMVRELAEQTLHGTVAVAG